MKLRKAYSERGADMGRPMEGTPKGIVRLQRVKLDSGGYDSGGAYWGVGRPLFIAFNEDDDYQQFVRADSRNAAKEKIRGYFPNVRFFR